MFRARKGCRISPNQKNIMLYTAFKYILTLLTFIYIKDINR